MDTAKTRSNRAFLSTPAPISSMKAVKNSSRRHQVGEKGCAEEGLTEAEPGSYGAQSQHSGLYHLPWAINRTMKLFGWELIHGAHRNAMKDSQELI
jgi:hypothetical protein